MNKMEVGKRYLSDLGDTWDCIAVHPKSGVILAHVECPFKIMWNAGDCVDGEAWKEVRKPRELYAVFLIDTRCYTEGCESHKTFTTAPAAIEFASKCSAGFKTKIIRMVEDMNE